MPTTAYLAIKGVDYCAGPIIGTVAVFREENLREYSSALLEVVDSSKAVESWINTPLEKVTPVLDRCDDWDYVSFVVPGHLDPRELKERVKVKVMASLSRVCTRLGVRMATDLVVTSYKSKYLSKLREKPTDFKVREIVSSDITQLTLTNWRNSLEYQKHLKAELHKECRLYEVSKLADKPETEHLDAVLKIGPSPRFHRTVFIKRLALYLRAAINKGELNERYEMYFTCPPNWWFQFFPYTPFTAESLTKSESYKLVERQKLSQEAYKYILKGPQRLTPIEQHAALEIDRQISIFDLVPENIPANVR